MTNTTSNQARSTSDFSNLTRLRARILSYPGPQYEIAGATGIHPSQLSRYSLHNDPIQPEHLDRLSRFFDCDPEDLLGYVPLSDPYWENS